MTIVANTFLTFDAKGIREELSDVIYNISPEDTPFISMSGKEKVSNTLYEWQTDALGAVDTTNAHLEGDDVASFDAVTPTARVGNYAQISRKTLIISGTEEIVRKAGRRSELAYQTAQRGKELKRDMESISLENIAGDAGSSTTARDTATLGAWLKTNVSKAGDGTNPSYTQGVPSAARGDGTQRAFTETLLKAAISSLWTAGGTLKQLMVGPFNKTVASGFSGIATTNFDLSRPRPAAIIAAADVYVSDFGFLTIMPNRFQRERDAWLLDFEFLSIAHVRPFRVTKLAKTGDAEKRLMLVEWGLKVKQEAALAAVVDLTVS